MPQSLIAHIHLRSDYVNEWLKPLAIYKVLTLCPNRIHRWENLKTIFMDTWIYSTSICDNPSSISSFSQVIFSFQGYDCWKMCDGKKIIIFPIENSLNYCSQGIPKRKTKWYTLQRNNCTVLTAILAILPLHCYVAGVVKSAWNWVKQSTRPSKEKETPFTIIVQLQQSIQKFTALYPNIYNIVQTLILSCFEPKD